VSEIVSRPYCLVQPNEYNEEQKKFIEKIKETICIISAQTDLILGAKDVNSHPLILTDACSRLLDLPRYTDEDHVNRCATTCTAQQRVLTEDDQEDRDLLMQGDINKKISVLTALPCRDGLRAMVFDKQLLKHVPSQSVLGIFFSAREIELQQCFTVIPNFVLEFGTGVSIEKSHGPLNLRQVKFSEYEHEVCYLMTMNWTCRQIADFFNQYRPKAVPRCVDTIYKCRNRICDKLGITDYSTEKLRVQLISMGLHRKMPQSFFNRILERTSGVSGP